MNNNVFTSNINSIQQLHEEANGIQEYMKQTADLNDPTSLTIRLSNLDSYMARLGEMLITAKALRSTAKTSFVNEREDLNKMTATVSNRIIDAHMQDYNILYDRLDNMYETIRTLTRDLVTQISYIKEQMRNLQFYNNNN